MVNVEDMRLRGAGSTLKRQIWDAARDTIQEWTGEELTDCSLYGIRVYTEGSVLATHVDRLPLVSSAILNVDQDVDEPWPIEVYAHDGKAYNVTMEPGDMVSGRDDEKRVWGRTVCCYTTLSSFLGHIIFLNPIVKLSLLRIYYLGIIRESFSIARSTLSIKRTILRQYLYSL